MIAANWIAVGDPTAWMAQAPLGDLCDFRDGNAGWCGHRIPSNGSQNLEETNPAFENRFKYIEEKARILWGRVEFPAFHNGTVSEWFGLG